MYREWREQRELTIRGLARWGLHPVLRLAIVFSALRGNVRLGEMVERYLYKWERLREFFLPAAPGLRG